MRHGHIDKSDGFYDLLADPLFTRAFTWLDTNRSPAPREEPYLIAGEDLYARVIEYIPRHPDAGRFETHHQFVDLHVVWGPHPERIMIADARKLGASEDIPVQDVTFHAAVAGEISSQTILRPGEFLIFNTEIDAHLPQCLTLAQIYSGARHTNLKVVIKLRKSALTPRLQL